MGEDTRRVRLGSIVEWALAAALVLAQERAAMQECETRKRNAAELLDALTASGRAGEMLYDAHPERVRYGARFVAHVDFDRAETWRVRVVTAAPAPVATPAVIVR